MLIHHLASVVKFVAFPSIYFRLPANVSIIWEQEWHNTDVQDEIKTENILSWRSYSITLFNIFKFIALLPSPPHSPPTPSRLLKKKKRERERNIIIYYSTINIALIGCMLKLHWFIYVSVKLLDRGRTCHYTLSISLLNTPPHPPLCPWYFS